MRVTLIQPGIGRRVGQTDYIGTWQMEPLTIATLAGLTPAEISLSFYDDRLELIPYSEPTDLVVITVETYTAKRAYQIASHFRKKDIPVVMGGFHATLCPEEVSLYAEAVIVGAAEPVWEKMLSDASRNSLQPYYYSDQKPFFNPRCPDRSLFANKKYLPIRLLEGGRGCSFHCEFCAVQTVFQNKRTTRPKEAIAHEINQCERRPLFFFVDDNISSNMDEAKEFLRSLIPLKIRWVSQMSLNAAHDAEFLELLVQSGCQGVLIGFESLSPDNLIKMKKGVNLDANGFESALAQLRKYAIRLYATFVFGYDADTLDSFARTVDFALKNRFYITAFNHLTPFPGTPLYKRLEQENRLLYQKWWLDKEYRYNKIPFQPAAMSPAQLQQGCIDARSRFYSMRSIWLRSLDKVNRHDFKMWLQFFGINWAIKKEIAERDHFPLGDEGDLIDLIQVREHPVLFSLH